MTISRLTLLLLMLAVLGAGVFQLARPAWVPVYYQVAGKRSLQDVVDRYGEAARERLAPHFEASGVSYPPDRLAFLVSKEAGSLEVWSRGESPVFIRAYDIRAQSGGPGPKLREGDRQVPEGFYRLVGLNPNSAFHLSMKLDYPNAFDRRHAAAEGRHEPGSDIFIHGKAVSVGCLAMGDQAIEELFILTVDTGRDNVEVAIAPRDPRLGPLSAAGLPRWTGDLYERLEAYFQGFGPASSQTASQRR